MWKILWSVMDPLFFSFSYLTNKHGLIEKKVNTDETAKGKCFFLNSTWPSLKANNWVEYCVKWKWNEMKRVTVSKLLNNATGNMDSLVYQGVLKERRLWISSSYLEFNLVPVRKTFVYSVYLLRELVLNKNSPWKHKEFI